MSLSRINASMGVRASACAGTAGLVSGRRDHQVCSTIAPLESSFAPCSIHKRIVAVCSAVSGAPTLGILGLDPVMLCSSGESSGRPALTTGPDAPPVNRACTLPTDSFPLRFVSLWHT